MTNVDISLSHQACLQVINMAKSYLDPKKDKYYHHTGVAKYSGEKAEAHFYPDITDEMLLSKKYNIEWTLSYADCLKKINNIEDFHTPQMAFCNPRTAETYDCFIHKINPTDNTQEVALVGFNSVGEVQVKEWV